MRPRLLSLHSSLALLVLLTCASASRPDELCSPTGSSTDDTVCSQKRLEVAERKLNELYKSLLAEVDEIAQADPARLGDLKSKLVAAQRAWVSFRQAECAAIQVWYKDGALQEALYNDCMRSHAERRAHELQSFTSYRT